MHNLKKFLILVLIFSLAGVVPVANATTELIPIKRFDYCQSPIQEWCISNVVAIDGSGGRYIGKASGRYVNYSEWLWKHFGNTIIGPAPEWKFDGISFEADIDRIVVQAFYFPNNGVDALQIYLEPSTLDQQRVLNVSNDTYPGICKDGQRQCVFGTIPWRFGGDVQLEVSIQTPRSFSPTYVSGRVSNLTIDATKLTPKNGQWFSTDATREVVAKLKPINLEQTDFSVPNPELAERALYSTDQPTIWISGLNNTYARNVLRYCIYLGRNLIVTSNAMSIGSPTWSESEGTVEVQLTTPHLATDGEKTRGYLEVRIDSSLAECLWNVDTRKLVGGEISMLYSEQEDPIILTVTTLQDGSDFRVVSTGFHFSSPTAKFKLKNEVKEETSSKEVTIEPKGVDNSLILNETIGLGVEESKIVAKEWLCVSKKKYKKVQNRKCPKGYRRVRS